MRQFFAVQQTCPHCQGTRYADQIRAINVTVMGVLKRVNSVVKIPAGVVTGDRIRRRGGRSGRAWRTGERLWRSVG